MVRTLGLFLVIAGLATALNGARLAWMAWFGQREQVSEMSELAAADGTRHPNGAPFGRIKFASQEQDYIVFEGASEDNLLRGPVHVHESAAPGEGGNVVIAAHRDTHFRLLKNVKGGQEITLEDGGHIFRYRVTETKVVAPGNTRYYQPTSNAVLTLVTCYPFYFIGAAPKRYIVRAELISFGG